VAAKNKEAVELNIRFKPYYWWTLRVQKNFFNAGITLWNWTGFTAVINKFSVLVYLPRFISGTWELLHHVKISIRSEHTGSWHSACVSSRGILYVEMVWTVWPHANSVLSPCIILRPWNLCVWVSVCQIITIFAVTKLFYL